MLGLAMSSSHQSPGPQPLAAAPGGPYLLAAFFCEKVIQEKDDVVSYIRQIDRLTTSASGPDAPSQMPQTSFSAFLVVLIKSGEARGSHEIKITREGPSGLRDSDPLLSLAVLLEGAERGAGVLGHVNLTFDQEGLFWFDVFLDNTLLTRIPFRVIYQRTSARMS